MRANHKTHSRKHIPSKVASLTTLILTCAIPVNVFALTCGRSTQSLSDAYEAADSIIVGLVTECAEEVSSEPWANGGGDCSFVSLDVLKESKPSRDYRGVASSSGCGLSLWVGKQYLLFLDKENRLLQLSGGLSGEQYPSRVSASYARILRDYRDGIVNDLSEPWDSRELEGSCVLSQSVNGHQIWFHRQTARAAEASTEGWTKEVVDGKTIYSGNANATQPFHDFRVVISGDSPAYAPDAQMLSIRLQEKPPTPERKTTISVGNRTWALFRREMTFSAQQLPENSQTEYVIGGETAEEILSAMERPSDVVVSAVLANPSSYDRGQPTEAALESKGSGSQVRSGDVYFGQVLPGNGQVRKSDGSRATPSRRYEHREEPPEQVLRIETRTTHLASVVESFRACNKAGLDGH